MRGDGRCQYLDLDWLLFYLIILPICIINLCEGYLSKKTNKQKQFICIIFERFRVLKPQRSCLDFLYLLTPLRKWPNHSNRNSNRFCHNCDIIAHAYEVPRWQDPVVIPLICPHDAHELHTIFATITWWQIDLVSYHLFSFSICEACRITLVDPEYWSRLAV